MSNIVEILAPVPGLVTSVAVDVGASVAAGETLVMLQAMKMEIPVAAEHAGTVDAVLVSTNQEVDMGAVLVHLRRG